MKWILTTGLLFWCPDADGHNKESFSVERKKNEKKKEWENKFDLTKRRKYETPHVEPECSIANEPNKRNRASATFQWTTMSIQKKI